MAGKQSVLIPKKYDMRGTGRWRLPGESRMEMCRRLEVYEHLREKFTQWILVERRPYLWIAEELGCGYSTVTLIASALEIYMHKPRKVSEETKVRERLPRAEQPRPPRVVRISPHTLAAWHKQEVEFQQMRLAYCSAWDRGW